jgi:hypothetical protein
MRSVSRMPAPLIKNNHPGPTPEKLQFPLNLKVSLIMNMKGTQITLLLVLRYAGGCGWSGY